MIPLASILSHIQSHFFSLLALMWIFHFSLHLGGNNNLFAWLLNKYIVHPKCFHLYHSQWTCRQHLGIHHSQELFWATPGCKQYLASFPGFPTFFDCVKERGKPGRTSHVKDVTEQRRLRTLLPETCMPFYRIYDDATRKSRLLESCCDNRLSLKHNRQYPSKSGDEARQYH